MARSVAAAGVRRQNLASGNFDLFPYFDVVAFNTREPFRLQ